MTTYAEPMVARVSGVKKALLVKTRKAALLRETDWVLDGAVVAYTPAGLKKILDLLGVDGAALAWPTAGAPDTPQTEEEAREEAADGGAEASQPIVETPTPTPAEPADESAPADLALGAEAFLRLSQAHADKNPGERRPDAAAVIAAGIALQQAALDAREVQTLTITRISRNPILVHARLEGDPVERTIRVRTNINFLPRMTITARPPAAGGAPVWFHVGNCPRWRGRY